jgi:pyridinium-3,5-bisthiocarboxylic acid mononucleotide nickel chelatase
MTESRDLWIEPFGGCAGDMLLAALLDLDDPRFAEGDLITLAEELVPGEAELTFSRVQRGGLAARHMDLSTPETVDPPHRHLAQLVDRLGAASLSGPAQRGATATLTRLAEAEAQVHDVPLERVHLHEVGAVDTLVDVAGAHLALARLGIDRVFVSPPLVGEGTVRCAHGEMPVPAPAVAQLLLGRPFLTGGGRERLTPTAAAFLTEHTEAFAAPVGFTATATGLGAGTADPKVGPPNLVRVHLGKATASSTSQRVPAWRLDVNLDDMTAEEVGHALQRLREAGALEAWSSPVSMKKDRQAALVSALAREDSRAALEAVCFEWTTTFGVRWTALERAECGRSSLSVEVDGQAVRVKVRERPDYPGRAPFGPRDLFPEHDDVGGAADATGRTLREVRALAIERALDQLR